MGGPQWRRDVGGGGPLPDHEVDDNVLVRRIAEGDAAAFRALYERYAPPLLNYFYRRLADRAVAEDLLQELFIRMIRAADRFDPDRPFAAWFYALAANLVRDAYRRRAVRPREVALDHVPEQALVDEAADPLVLLTRQLDAELVRRAVATLPLSYREVLVERVYESRSFGEIAARLGIAEATARWRMHEALRRLRQALLAGLAGRDGSEPAR